MNIPKVIMRITIIQVPKILPIVLLLKILKVNALMFRSHSCKLDCAHHVYLSIFHTYAIHHALINMFVLYLVLKYPWFN